MVYVGCVLIMFLSAYFGKVFANKYVMRDKFYRHLTNMCLYFKTNIGFNHTKLEKLFDDFENHNNQEFFSQIMMLKKLCLSLNKSSEDIDEVKKSLNFLTNEELDILISKITQIGSNEESLELEKLEDFMLYTIQKQKEHGEQRKKLEPLSYKLSLAIGLVISILII